MSKAADFFISFFFTHIYFPASGQAVVTGVVPFAPRFLPSIFIAHRVQQFHCSSIFHRVLLTHALALSASQFVHKKKSPGIYTSVHSRGLELTKLTYNRLEDNLISHRGDRLIGRPLGWAFSFAGLSSAVFVLFIVRETYHTSDNYFGNRSVFWAGSRTGNQRRHLDMYFGASSSCLRAKHRSITLLAR